jgi:hypothetical protein
MRTIWYVGSHVIAEADIEWPWLQPDSIAYGCPHCGEIWARKHILGSERWVFPCAPCPSCPPYYDHFPGSLLVGELAFSDRLPPELFAYELSTWARNGATE